MIRTNYDFIHEYDAYDDVVDCLESAKRDIALAFYEYERTAHQAEMSAFFEGTDGSEKTAKASSNVFERIGNKIISIIHSVSEFIKKVLDKVLGDTPLVKTDSEKITELIKEHPELQKKIVDGIDKGWFTQKDVAKYHKDVVGLIRMLDKNAIDHATFMDKMKKCGEELSKSAKTVTVITGATASILALGPKVLNGVKGVREELSKFTAELESIKDRIVHNYAKNDMSKAQAISAAINEAVGLMNAEANDRAKGHKSLLAFFKSFLSKNTTRDSLNDEEQKRKDEETAKQAEDEAHETNVRNAAKARQNRKDFDENETRTQATHQANVEAIQSKAKGEANRKNFDSNEYKENLTHRQQVKLIEQEHKDENPNLYPKVVDDSIHGGKVYIPKAWDKMSKKDRVAYLQKKNFSESLANIYADRSRSIVIKFINDSNNNNSSNNKPNTK